MMDRPTRNTYRLTRQEKRVLALLLQGHHKKTAADAMGVSVNTISFHLKNAYCKLGVHSKTEAVVKGLLEGILVPEYAPPPVMGYSPETAR
ncbi:MAG TPA: helix-turn-helix transcriptional regulator [Vicinamibacterales bacterium]|jgi:DNA-binding CsgD family transcriptional regulator